MSKRLWIVASAVVLAVCIAPFALAAGEGQPVRGGARNPSNNNSQAYTRETQIIADNSSGVLARGETTPQPVMTTASEVGRTMRLPRLACVVGNAST